MLRTGGRAAEGDAAPPCGAMWRGRGRTASPGALSRTEGTRHARPSPSTREPDRGRCAERGGLCAGWPALSELLRWKLSSKGKGGLAGHSDIYPLGPYSGVTYREPRSKTFTRGGGVGGAHKGAAWPLVRAGEDRREGGHGGGSATSTRRRPGPGPSSLTEGARPLLAGTSSQWPQQ